MPGLSVASRRLTTSSVAALIVVALIAVFQTSVIFYNVGAQSDAAHIIDISGLQRSHSQRLAYLALSLTTPYPAPFAKAEIASTIAAMARTRAELRRQRRYDSGPRDRTGRTELGKLSDRYVRSVRAVVDDPHDRSAVLLMERLRPLVFEGFDRAVQTRVAAVRRQNQAMLFALLAGLLLQIGSIVGVWLRLVAPAEEKNRRLLADVQQARGQIESTFAENPDAIAIYDTSGHLVRENASRIALIGARPIKMARQHVSAGVDTATAPVVRTLFADALAGKTARGDFRIMTADRSLVDVSATFFPYLVSGTVAGVTVVAKDVRKIRALEESNAEQARRLTDLYQIASSAGRTTKELLDSAVALVTARLNYDHGLITEIADGMVTVVSTTGAFPGLRVGEIRPLESSMARLALSAPDVYEDRDFFNSEYGELAMALELRSVAGMKIFTEGVLYGTVGFSTHERRERELSSADVSFMRLACALIGAIIERGRQIKRLDSLAFFDSLTGLPNRSQFSARIQELLAGKRRFALHYVDLDRFKKINDRYGHSAGDAVLKIAAKRLLGCARADDLVVRLGGDEFAIVQTATTGRIESAQLAKRVVAAFAEPIDLGGIVVEIGASVGIAIRPRSAVEARTLIEAADAALYSAKRNGRGRFAHAASAEEMWLPKTSVANRS